MELIGWNVRKKCSSRDGFQPLYPELFIKTKIFLEIQQTHQPRTEADSMPSPLGERQTDTPIKSSQSG